MGYIFSSLGLFHRKTSDILRGYIARRTLKHKIIEIIFALIIAGALFAVYRTAYSATFTFTQTSWSGGSSATNATHPGDKTGWNKYSSKDSSVAIVNSGADLQIATTTTFSITQTTDTDFNAGATSSTIVSGTGSSANVLLSSNTWTGGTVTQVGNDSINTFTTSGTLTASSGGNAQVLVVAGGGGAGTAGGGGGGGVRSSSTFAIASGDTVITVGSGGNSSHMNGNGFFDGHAQKGGNSSIGSFVSTGGGQGQDAEQGGGSPGGSGGGGAGLPGSTIAGGTGNTPATSPSQGNDGGSGFENGGGTTFAGGGGGGANAVGGSGGASGGNGGAGVASSISGSSVTYGGGGGGGTYLLGGSPTPGSGGSGGGGQGGSNSIDSTSGTANRGGGAGAAGYTSGGNVKGNATTTGGSGIVIIRHTITYPSTGTFTSSVINTGQKSVFTTLGFTKTTPTNTTLTVDVRGGNTASPDGSWSSWQTNISNGGSISALNGYQYVQYRANLATTDTSTSSQLSDVTFNYYSYQSVDPYWSNVTALLHMDGSNNGTTFTDETGKTWTAGGDAKTSTSQIKYGTASLATTGSAGAGRVVSTSNGLSLGSGDFTVEFFYRANATGASQPSPLTFAEDLSAYNNANNWVFIGNYQNNVSVWIANSKLLTSAVDIYDLNWHHLVFERISGTGYLYIDGTLQQSTGIGTNFSNTSGMWIANQNDFTDRSSNGNIDEFRVTRGVGRYSSNFTPPTASFSAGTSTLISSAYNSNSSGNVMGHISWTATTPTGTAIKFQVRSAPDSAGSPGTWSGWMGPDGTSATYFTDSSGGETMPSALRDGSNDQWFQYKVFLETTDTSVTPTLSDVSLTYVVNAPPEFDATYGTNGIYVQQVSTSSDSTFGLTNIQYKIRDPDTLSGSVTPALVTPSFYYNIGGGWVSIPSQYLSSTSTSNKTVAEVAYNLYHALWDAKSQIPGTYSASAQVRVNLNDNEGANNTSSSTSASFVLDTANPSVTASIDGVAGTVNISATDNSQIIDYNISNNSNMSSATTGSGTSTSFAFSTPWTFANSSSSATVYTTIRDKYNNVATTTIVAPVIPSGGLDIRDVSKPSTGIYQEMLLWPTYVSGITGATFQDYKLYRSSDGNSYSLLTTITNPSINYYLDSTVNASTTYYYKVKFTDTDGDTSAYSNVVTDLPDGQGGTDNTAPTISNVVISDIKNTSAKITWTTDELSNSKAEFGVTTAYGSQNTDQSYTTSHSVYITGLTSNTSYKVRLKSTDPAGNIGTNDNGGAGYSLTTVGGPVITNVTVSDISDSQATIFWNTNLSSDSYVDYSTNSDLSNYAEGGSADLVTGTSTVYQHKITITGLSGASTYYFQVSSREGGGSQTIDTNNGSYYQFKTTYDTKAPTITEVQTPVRASDSAVITWKTDELSDSQIEYGVNASTTHGGYAKTTTLVTTPTIFHSITLSRQTNDSLGSPNTLTKSSTYYYRVISKDPSGNTSYSSEGTFDTTADGAVIYASTGGGSAANAVTQADIVPPTITDIHVDHITPFGASIIFNTSEDARGLVQYGDDDKDLKNNASDSIFASKHIIEIRGLKMGTTYTYLVDAIDKSGNVGFAERATFKTPFLSQDLGALEKLNNNVDSIQQKIEDLVQSALPSINPPFIDRPTVDAIGEDFATISFKTNVKAYGLVSYATDDDYKRDGKYTQEESKLDVKSMDHTIDLSGLKSNTKYHYSVKAYVFPGAPSQTEDMTFITSASKIDARITERKIDSFHVVWTTDAPSTSVVEYKKKGSVKAEKKSDDAMTTYHDVLVDHLVPATTYEVRPYSITKDGNIINPKSGLVVTTIKDITPPAISGFKVDSALVTGRNDRTQTIVSWKTDEPSTSVVYYEEGSGSPNKALANKQEDASSYTQNHVVILTSLKPGSIYRFQIASSDEAGNITKLPIRTIVTPKANESVVDVIFKNFDDTFNFIKKTQ